MPGRHNLEQEVSGRGPDVVRKKRLAELARHTGHDTILYAAGLGTKLQGIPSLLVSINSNDMQAMMSALHGLKGKALDLIIISGGGSGETAEQMVNYLRAKYMTIRAIVPQNAMSAATMIACACDSILMGKQSALGPIDPQMVIPTPNGPSQMPAQEILQEFDQAKREIVADPRVAPIWVTKIQNLPPGFLAACGTASERSITLVRDWLHRYMKLSEAKADEVAKWLGNSREHKSHGRPICAEMAKSKGLNIEFLEDDQKLQDKVLDVFHATMLTFLKSDCVKLVENQCGRGEYTKVQVTPMMPGVMIPRIPGPGGVPTPGPRPLPAGPPVNPPVPVPPAPPPAANSTVTTKTAPLLTAQEQAGKWTKSLGDY